MSFFSLIVILLLSLFIIIYLGWMNAWKVQRHIGKFLLALFIGGTCLYFFIYGFMKFLN